MRNPNLARKWMLLSNTASFIVCELFKVSDSSKRFHGHLTRLNLESGILNLES